MSFVQLPADAIRDTAAAVFRAPVYNRTSLLEIIGSWLREHVAAFQLRLRPGRMPAPLFWFVVIVIFLVVVGVVARAVTIMVRERTVRRAGAAGGTGAEPDDAWAMARRFATHGDYTAAAHALYAGILDVIARRDAVELHESKTIGDYARDLAARSSAVLARFREFASDYEVVIYGIGRCDRDRYERLDGLALRILESGV
ncbi:MAG: DUF4129 domain-containing protein [Gemmatimonadota bacterium]